MNTIQYIPIVSTAYGLFEASVKFSTPPLFSSWTPNMHRIHQKSKLRITLSLVPIIGNLALIIYDLAKALFFHSISIPNAPFNKMSKEDKGNTLEKIQKKLLDGQYATLEGEENQTYLITKFGYVTFREGELIKIDLSIPFDPYGIHPRVFQAKIDDALLTMDKLKELLMVNESVSLIPQKK